MSAVFRKAAGVVEPGGDGPCPTPVFSASLRCDLNSTRPMERTHAVEARHSDLLGRSACSGVDFVEQGRFGRAQIDNSLHL